MTSDPTALLLATAFSIFGALCVVLVLVGLPGAWLLIATAIAIDCLDWIWLAPNAPLTFHPLTIVVAILIATAGEAMEFALSAAGAKRFGASRAGMIGAMIGGPLVGILSMFAIYQFGGHFQNVVSLAVLVLVLMFKPEGLFGRASARRV